MKQASYSRLWGYGNKSATSDYSPFKTDEEAKKFRDALYAKLKKQGVKVRRASLTGQMRPYWGWQEPCGDSCTVYYLNFEG